MLLRLTVQLKRMPGHPVYDRFQTSYLPLSFSGFKQRGPFWCSFISKSPLLSPNYCQGLQAVSRRYLNGLNTKNHSFRYSGLSSIYHPAIFSVWRTARLISMPRIPLWLPNAMCCPEIRFHEPPSFTSVVSRGLRTELEENNVWNNK